MKCPYFYETKQVNLALSQIYCYIFMATKFAFVIYRVQESIKQLRPASWPIGCSWSPPLPPHPSTYTGRTSSFSPHESRGRHLGNHNTTSCPTHADINMPLKHIQTHSQKTKQTCIKRVPYEQI